MNKSFVLIASIFAVACGSAEENEALRAELEKKQTAANTSQETEQPSSFSVASEDKLPACNLKREGYLAYVQELKQLKVCTSDGWIQADLETIPGVKGKDGKDGKDGRDGVDGKDGLNGKDGINGKDGLNGLNGADGKDGAQGLQGAKGDKGEQGIQGVQGIQGIQGIQGERGTDGVTTTVYQHVSNLPQLKDANGVLIGDVVQWDSAYSSYLVNAPSGLRLRVGNLGTFRAYQFVYTSADCSGTEYLMHVPELWEEMVVANGGNRVRTGNPVSRAVQSRMMPGGTCQAYSNTVKTYALRALTATESAEVWTYGIPFVD